MKKKKKFVFLAVFLILLAVFFVIFFILTFGSNNGNSNNFLNNIFTAGENSSQDVQDANNENQNTEVGISGGKDFNSGSESGGGGGSAGGSSGQGSESQPDSSCLIEISYSLINFNETSVCTQYQDDICTHKTISCSLDVHNRDEEVSGFFELEMLFVEEQGSLDDPIDTRNSRFFLEADSYHSIAEILNIVSYGGDGDANKEIHCFYNTLDVPKKEVC